MLLAKIRSIVVAIVASRRSAHVELTVINAVLGMQRNDDVPFAVNKLAASFRAIGRSRTITDPFIKRSITAATFYRRVIDFHAITRSGATDLVCGVPTCPVL